MKISLELSYSRIQNTVNSSLPSHISPMHKQEYAFEADADNQTFLGATERTQEIGKLILFRNMK